MRGLILFALQVCVIAFAGNAETCAYVEKDGLRCSAKAAVASKYCNKHNIDGRRQERENAAQKRKELERQMAEAEAQRQEREARRKEFEKACIEGRTHSSSDKLFGLFGQKFGDIVSASGGQYKQSNRKEAYYFTPKRKFSKFQDYLVIVDNASNRVAAICAKTRVKDLEQAKSLGKTVIGLLEKKYGREMQVDNEEGHIMSTYLLFGYDGVRSFSHRLSFEVWQNPAPRNDYTLEIMGADLRLAKEMTDAAEKDDLDAL